MTGKDRKTKNKKSIACPGPKTGIDVAEAVKNMIKEQYPGMSDKDAVRLAVLLTKAQFNGDI